MSQSNDIYKYEMTVIRNGKPIRSMTVEKQVIPIEDRGIGMSESSETEGIEMKKTLERLDKLSAKFDPRAFDNIDTNSHHMITKEEFQQFVKPVNENTQVETSHNEIAEQEEEQTPKVAPKIPSSFDDMMKSVTDQDVADVQNIISSMFAFKNEDEKSAMNDLVGTIIGGFKRGDVTNDEGKLEFGKLHQMAENIAWDEKEKMDLVKESVQDKFKTD